MNTGSRKGIPIGNLTSQLFANVYMNKFDQFIKHELKIKNYVRYTDDFIIVGGNRECLKNILPKIGGFLQDKLALKLHPNKISIRKLHQGIDFLGYIIFSHHRLLRTKTKRRIFKKLQKRAEEYRMGKISGQAFEQSLQSYLGVLSHANSHRLSERLLNEFCQFLY